MFLVSKVTAQVRLPNDNEVCPGFARFRVAEDGSAAKDGQQISWSMPRISSKQSASSILWELRSRWWYGRPGTHRGRLHFFPAHFTRPLACQTYCSQFAAVI